MRILITGASGFVGSYLIRHIREALPDAEIVGTVHVGSPAPPSDDPRLRFVPCDITANHGRDVHSLIAHEAPDHLYHLAGMASGAAQDRAAVFAANVDGTRSIMSAVASEVPLARVLFVSTGYVYGPCDPARPAREDDPLQAHGVYAESKREAEPYARAAGAITVRAFNHTGPGQTEAFAVPAFAKQIAQIEAGEQAPPLQVGNLDARRDFLDVRDVVRAYRLLMEQGETGGVYNVCSGEALPMHMILDDLRALATVPIGIIPDPARMRPSDLPVSVGDPSRLKVVTQWEPQIPFEQTLRETLGWWRHRRA